MTIPDSGARAAELRQLAKKHIESHHLESAQAALEKLIHLTPDDVPACMELAGIMTQQNQWKASGIPLLQAVQHLPRHAPLLLKLVQLLMSRGEVVAARQCLDFLGQAPQPPVELLLAQAHLRFLLGEISSARELTERALGAGADDPDDHHLHAMTLQFTGALDEACQVLIQCLQRWPHYGDAAVVLANLHKQAPNFDLLAHVEKQLERMPKPANDPNWMFIHASFEYARFKLLDDAGQHDAAWSSLERCNALMHALNPYDAREVTEVTDALIQTPGVIASHAISPSSFDGPVPIFIVGMPRSGTTLLDRMLSSHSAIATAGEIFDFSNQLHAVANIRPHGLKGFREVVARSADLDMHELGLRYLRQTQWRAGNRRFYIDKLPNNIQAVAFIRRALPHAPIVHITRSPIDVCFSNFKAMFGNSSAYSYEQKSLAHYYKQHERLVAHWRERIPDAMLEVSYASLVDDPAPVLQRILARCGLEMEPDCLHPERNKAPVATPSNAQVREPIHNRGNQRWRDYADQLQPLKQALGEAGLTA